MAPWLQYLIAFVAVVVAAPLLAWSAKRIGRKTKGGLMLSAALLGFGDVFDRPARDGVEATQVVKGSPDNGEPPLD